jgi:hypothetical protein
MNAFLVMVICAFDTKPWRLFATQEEALAFAEALEVVNAQHSLPRGCIELLRLRERAMAVAIVPFVDGVPGELMPVKWFAHAKPGTAASEAQPQGLR